MTVLGKKEKREREKAKCYPKNHFIKANIAQFVLGLAQIPEIIGGKERDGGKCSELGTWGLGSGLGWEGKGQYIFFL